VHVSQTLKGLEKDGLVVRTKRHISISNWERLRTAAGSTSCICASTRWRL